MGSKLKSNAFSGDGASPGKIFIGGLARETYNATFNKHFGKYGEIVDSVIIKDRVTGQPRGFGFITFADPSVVDKVMEEDTHVINGKQVEIKRTIPKGSGQSKDFKTKKIFVGGIPTTVTEDELKDSFSQYGKVVEHQIIHDHETKRSRGFGFVAFDTEETVDEMLSKGNKIEMFGAKVEIKKAEPKKPSNLAPAPYGTKSRARTFSDAFADSYGPFDGRYGPGPYRSPASFVNRLDGPYRYGYNSNIEEIRDSRDLHYDLGYRGDPSLNYSSRFGPYGIGHGEGYSGNTLGGYSQGGVEGYGRGVGHSLGSDFGPGGDSYGGPGGYARGDFSGRYHPYGR